jgi:hypothetical protein
MGNKSAGVFYIDGEFIEKDNEWLINSLNLNLKTNEGVKKEGFLIYKDDKKLKK